MDLENQISELSARNLHLEMLVDQYKAVNKSLQYIAREMDNVGQDHTGNQ